MMTDINQLLADAEKRVAEGGTSESFDAAMDYSVGYGLDTYSSMLIAQEIGRREGVAQCDNDMKSIGELIRTQDNRITDQPMFIVEREITDYGYDSFHADEYHWLDDEGCAADDDESDRLDELDDDFDEDVPDEWKKLFYKKRWEFVTACFTEQGCKDYLSRNGHNLGKTRIYAQGSYRNIEYQHVRRYLLDMAERQ